MAVNVHDAHHTCSLPSILDSYWSPKCYEKTAHVANIVTHVKKLKSRRSRKISVDPDSATDSDEVAEMKQKALLDQRHLETHRNIHRLQDMLSQRYAELLREKVDRQRKEMAPHNSAPLKNRGRHCGQRVRRVISQKLVRSTFNHDDTYLRSLPKSRHYLVLELQRHLGQHGYLQSHRDQEVFRYWVDQQKTAQLEKQLEQIAHWSKTPPDVKLEDLLKKPKVPPKIQVSTEDSQAHEDHTAVSETGGGEWVSSPRLLGKQTQELDEAELKFPRVFTQEIQLPKFATLQPSFSETFKTNVLLLKVKEPLPQLKDAEMTLQKLHLMHTLSLSRMTQSRSTLEQCGIALQKDKEYSIKDLLDHVCPNKLLTKESTCSRESPLPPQPTRDHATPEHPKAPNKQLSTTIDLKTSLQEPENFSCTKTMKSLSSHSVEPLCMEEVCHSHSISLGKGFIDKTWTNYDL